MTTQRKWKKIEQINDEVKRVDQLTVTVNVVCTKVSQQVTTATDFLHQTTVSSVVFFCVV